jgi:MFS family permease
MGSGACFVILGGALQAGAVTFPMFVVARCLTGIGSAISFTVTPMFISELAPAHSRGFLVSLHVVGMNAGYIISGFASLGFSYMTDEIQWRLSFIINAVVGILLLLALFFVPESPRWLITKGRFEEAKCTLDRLHINKYDLQGFNARAELYQIKAQVQADKDLPRGYLHILRTPTLRKRAYCTILVWFTSMGTGVLVISFFTPLLFAGLGYGSKEQFGLSIAYFALCAVSAFLGGLAVDRVGRRIYCGTVLLFLNVEDFELT